MTQPDPWQQPTYQPAYGQALPDAHAEYLRRAAVAAEATRRNTRILVWALVGVPLIIGAVVAVVLVVGSTATAVGQSQARSGLAHVQDVTRSVGYIPPSYTSIENQTRGICENLRTGMTQPAAAAAMAQGFGEGMTTAQAAAIVTATADQVCNL